MESLTIPIAHLPPSSCWHLVAMPAAYYLVLSSYSDLQLHHLNLSSQVRQLLARSPSSHVVATCRCPSSPSAAPLRQLLAEQRRIEAEEEGGEGATGKERGGEGASESRRGEYVSNRLTVLPLDVTEEMSIQVSYA